MHRDAAWLRRSLVDLPGEDTASAAAVRTRAADILRPTGALERLDELAAWIAAWQGSPTPSVRRPAALVFAADHGVAAAGVSSYPMQVTAAMLEAFRAERATVSAFARVVGAKVVAVDVGVGRPTGDIRTEAALDPQRVDECIAAGAAAIDDLDADLVVLGEMGIGNTTAAAAVCAALLGGPDPTVWVGRGTGVDDDGLARKQRAVATAVERIAGVDDPLEVLREVGGAELVALAAAIVAARLRRLPVLLDGYVVTAAALALATRAPGALDHCRIAHCSAEPGHRRLVEHLGARPILDLGMRLGEASGAMAAVPLVILACAGVVDVPTFTEWFG